MTHEFKGVLHVSIDYARNSAYWYALARHLYKEQAWVACSVAQYVACRVWHRERGRSLGLNWSCH